MLPSLQGTWGLGFARMANMSSKMSNIERFLFAHKDSREIAHDRTRNTSYIQASPLRYPPMNLHKQDKLFCRGFLRSSPSFTSVKLAETVEEKINILCYVGH